MEVFLETYKILRLKQEELDFFKKSINYEEFETVINNLPKNKTPGLDGFPGEFYQTLNTKHSTHTHTHTHTHTANGVLFSHKKGKE